jgi:hypothetical protein
MKGNNGKWKIGKHGKSIYDTKEAAEKAYKGYLGKKYGSKKKVLMQGSK